MNNRNPRGCSLSRGKPRAGGTSVPQAVPLALLPLALFLSAAPAAAQEAAETALSRDALRIVAAEGRELVALIPPGAAAIGASARPAFIGVAARTFDTASRRVHEVSLDGETYRAAAPLHGPPAWPAFDPARRQFEWLQPNIRVELNGGAGLEAIARAVGATGVTVLESLGFAIVELPASLHPADAAARANAMAGRPVAALRLRGPPIEWR